MGKLEINPDPLKDQFFLTDDKIIKKIVEFANLERKDVVLEIGAGTGNLTKELAKRAGKVIVFEIDSRFKPFLSKLVVLGLSLKIYIYYNDSWDLQ